MENLPNAMESQLFHDFRRQISKFHAVMFKLKFCAKIIPDRRILRGTDWASEAVALMNVQ